MQEEKGMNLGVDMFADANSIYFAVAKFDMLPAATRYVTYGDVRVSALPTDFVGAIIDRPRAGTETRPYDGAADRDWRKNRFPPHPSAALTPSPHRSRLFMGERGFHPFKIFGGTGISWIIQRTTALAVLCVRQCRGSAVETRNQSVPYAILLLSATASSSQRLL